MINVEYYFTHISYLYHYDFQLSVNITFASLFLLFSFPHSRLEKAKKAMNDDSAY